MSSDRPGRTVVVASEHRLFRRWCSDNNIFPNDPNVFVVTNFSPTASRLRGWKWDSDKDRLVILEHPHAPVLSQVMDEVRQRLIPMGCPEF